AVRHQADDAAIACCRRLDLARGAPGRNLAVHLRRTECISDVVREFVEAEGAALDPRAGLDPGHGEPCLAETARRNAACGAETDDCHVDRRQALGLPGEPGHGSGAGSISTSSAWSRSVNTAFGPGKPISRQPAPPRLPPCTGSANIPCTACRRTSSKKFCGPVPYAPDSTRASSATRSVTSRSANERPPAARARPSSAVRPSSYVERSSGRVFSSERSTNS